MHICNLNKCIIQLLLLYIAINLSCCSSDIDGTKYSITLTSNDLIIPLPDDVYLERVKFDVYNSDIVYKNGYDICFYNPNTNDTRIDTFLRKLTYNIHDYYTIFGSYQSGLLLDDLDHLILYDLEENNIDFLKYNYNIDGNSQNFHISRTAFGWSNRDLDDFVFSNNIYRYKPSTEDFEFYLGAINLPQKNQKVVAMDFPQDVLNNIYNFNRYLLSPMIEDDLTGNGVNINFLFSCKVYNVKNDGKLNYFEKVGNRCDCGLNKTNVIAAKSDNKLNPSMITSYGNLFPDKYRGNYYQVYSCKKNIEAESKTTFLRILDEKYEVLAETELAPLGLIERFICHPDGLFVQSVHPTDSSHEKSVTFKKIELIRR